MNQQRASTSTRLLTGIPRSGTSLCCRLVGDSDTAVALSEPIRMEEMDHCTNSEEAVKFISQYAQSCRSSLVLKGVAPSTELNGQLDDERVSEQPGLNGLRAPKGQQGNLEISTPLSKDFLLLIKHNALFAAILPDLNAEFCVLGLVRNPLAVLASWQTVDLPVNRGRVPAGERFAPDLAARLDTKRDTLDRQILILDWFFARYRECLSDSSVLRYEEVIESHGEVLFSALDITSPPVSLSGRNANPLYQQDFIAPLVEALLRYPGAWRDYYTDTAILELAGMLELTR